ncbi:MAG: sugar transferase [Erythrobacter sp.]
MNRPPMALATAKRAQVMRPSRQILAYVLGGVLAPAVVWSLVRGIPIDANISLITLAHIGVANLVVWYTLNRLRTYARARLLSYVFPVNLLILGVIFASNALLRESLSYSLYLACAAATLFVSYVVTTRVRHANPKLRHVIIPIGDIGSVLKNAGFQEVSEAEALNSMIKEGQITGSIVADLHHDHSPEWERLLAAAALKGIPVYHYRLIEEALTGEVRINHLRENDLGSLIPNTAYRTAKRVFDVAMVVVFSPFLLIGGILIAAIIKLDSKGNVFFFQERIGYRGEEFRMVKFRTMRDRDVADTTDARRDDAITQDGDQRITRIGGFLRKTRMDELPQAWNVLIGDMSWIGPRPEALELSKWYAGEIPFYAYRHIVRPGITGWAQVNQGHVADLDSIQQKLRFDFFYVKNLSLWLDILIGLKTVRVIIGGMGAK